VVGPDPRVALRSAEPDEAVFAALAKYPWARDYLQCIADRPAVRAPDLAESFGRETAAFNRDIRKLKELGLTESLDVGYRLSPRGELVLRDLAQGS
jgi:predicted transcriptional regulator